MPRLRSKRSGAVVNISDETATLLSHLYEPIEDEKPKRAAAKKQQTEDDQ